MTIDAQLRKLDPAGGQLDARQRARADALLERIVTEPHAPRRSRNSKIVWRTGGIVAVGALVAAAATILPAFTTALPAVATWTPQAGPVSAHDLPIAEQACRDQFERYDSAINGRTPVVLAERRGDLIGLVFWQPNPDTQGSCLVEIPTNSNEVIATTSAVSGSTGDALVPPEGEFSGGALSEFTVERGKVSMTTGAVGEGISAVTIHAGSLSVDATVEDGRYVAWWPGAAFESGSGEPVDIISYDLELADGTIVTRAEPWRP